MPREKILLRKKAVPKRVRLPNGQIFYAKYERIKRANLPPNVNVRRNDRFEKTKKLNVQPVSEIANNEPQLEAAGFAVFVTSEILMGYS